MTELIILSGSEKITDITCRVEFHTFAGFGVYSESNQIVKDSLLNNHSIINHERIPVMEMSTRKFIKTQVVPNSRARVRNSSQLDDLLIARGFAQAVVIEQAIKEENKEYVSTETITSESSIYEWNKLLVDVQSGNYIMVNITTSSKDTKSAGYILFVNESALERKMIMNINGKSFDIAHGKFDIVPQSILDENHAELNSMFHINKTPNMIKFFEKNEDGSFYPIAISDKCSIKNNKTGYSVNNYTPTRVLDFD